MAVLKQERGLTIEERRAVWAAIFSNKSPDDRDPHEVIEENYEGDVGAYLRKMAEWHGIPTGSIQESSDEKLNL